MAANNPCAKTVKPEEAYEVWQSVDSSWTWYVLKKYQSPENEAKNPYARWYCMVVTPIVPKGEYGDVYVSEIKDYASKLDDNPLHRFLCVKGASIKTLEEIGLSSYPLTELVLRDERLWQYFKISVPPKHFTKVKRMLEEHEIAIVCIDATDFLERCITDVQSSE